MKYDISPYYKYRQEICSRTIVLIGVFLILITFILTICNLILLNSLEINGNIGTVTRKIKYHLTEDVFSILNAMALILSAVSIIIGFISILRLKNIGWILMLVSIICFILNSNNNL